MSRRSRAAAPARGGWRGPRPLGLAAALLSLGAAACSDAGPGDWVDEGAFRWREVVPRGGGGFRSMGAPRRGIDFLYDVDEAAGLENRILAEGAGVAIGDVDGDGLADLFFAGFGGPSRLYVNRGGWRFEDATERAGIDLEGVLVRGAALVDVDGDVDLDLVLTVHGAPNRLLVNDGTGIFTNVADAGFEAARGSTTPALADIDHDGDLDLYVANYKTRQADDALSDVQRGSLHDLRPGPDGRIEVPPFLAEHYRVEFDGRFLRWWELGETDELYLNDGSGRFVEAPLAERFRDAAGRPVDDPLLDWGLVARFSDWDGDGDPDLYVANDFNSPDGIWMNRGDGTFDAAPATAIRSTSLSSMAVEMSDVDRDGDLDILTTDMLARDPRARRMQRPAFAEVPEPPGMIDARVQVNRNALQMNRGDRTFADVAHAAGIAASDWTWGALFLDVDLDGREDLLVTTGHLWNPLDADSNERVLRAPPGAIDWRRTLAAFPPLPQPNAAFRALGDGSFEDVTGTWGWGTEADISHGIAAGDLDADGDLDVVVTRLGEPPVLMRNESPAARVLVRLRGPVGNAHGVGAWIAAEGHPAGVQIDEIVAGGSYLSSSEPAAMFAVPADGSLRVTIDWPDGARSVVESAGPNREYIVRHPDLVPDRSTAGAAGDSGGPAAETVVPLFEDVSSRLGHAHVETAFDDRARQPLLPVSLGRLGPGVSWLDADGDDDPDLVVGSGRGGPVVLLRNLGGGFDAPRALTPALEFDATTSLPHRGPGGGLEIVIGASRYEAPPPADGPAAVAVPIGGGSAPRPAAPGAAAATGPLAQADIDGDGDLDIFLGGRMIPGAVPLPADSRIFRNDGGELVFDASRSVPFRELGLVSGAVFTDIDGDGDPDLALAMAWGPVRLFRNEGGGFSEVTGAVGLAEPSGRWNAITAGDFTGDGRMDLVATGWGTNTDPPSSYSLFHGDFDRDGRYDVIEAVRTEVGWRPIRRRDEIQAGLPGAGRFSYEQFADATVERLLGPAFGSAGRIDVDDSRHTVFLNRGDRFEARPLPREAQWSPSLGVAVDDFDGDGAEDIVLSQNFYAVRPGTPRYDAGRGLLLRGDGEGGFTAVSGIESGIRVYGDGRGIATADVDGDRRVDLAVGVNGGQTRLFLNRTARPGIRVRLAGDAENPDAVGATMWLTFADGSRGPAREVRSGEGYWSRSDPAQILARAGEPVAIHVRWPGGTVTEHPIPEGADDVEISGPGRE